MEHKNTFEVVIGLEIHVELLTESKMFCGCSAVTFGARPNTLVCPVCLGLPGALPVTNKKAVEYCVKTGLALDASIAGRSQFHRKNYFYPDMAKNYQISQYDLPLCLGGHLDADMNGYTRRVGITRVHLEEDTGKLVHVGKGGRIAEADYSLVDFNRSGVPLMEVVTEPDLRSPAEARVFLQKLKSLLEHLEVSDCNMEQGSLRCDANVSVRPRETEALGVKTEVKNMNSFKSLEKALSYEIERQKQIVADGKTVEHETRHFDEARGVTSSLRTKEFAHDYRYFPEPDLVPLRLERIWVEQLREKLAELPEARRNRFQTQYGLSAQDAAALTSSRPFADFFEECLKNYRHAKTVANWILGELSYHLNEASLGIDDSPVTPKHLVQLLQLIDDQTLSGKMAKEVFQEVFETGKLPQVIVGEKGLSQLADEGEIAKIVDLAFEENPKALEDLKAGKKQAFGFLVGQVMRLTRGTANPQLVNKIIQQKMTQPKDAD